VRPWLMAAEPAYHSSMNSTKTMMVARLTGCP
jgi:hypothetical protein